MTIKEIAKLSGVSITAVSFYMNGKHQKLSEATIKRIAKIIKETGYKPNRSARELRLKVTNNIAVVAFDITQRFAQDLYKSISAGLKDADFMMSIYETGLDFEEEKKVFDNLIENKTNTIIIQASKEFLNYLDTQEERLKTLDTRIVIIDSHGKNRHVNYFYANQAESIKRIVIDKDFANVDEFIFITNEVSKIQVRAKRQKMLSKEAKTMNAGFLTHEIFGEKITDEELDEIFSNKKSKIIWANSTEIAFDVYSYLERKGIANSKTHIVSMDHCYFASIVKVNLRALDNKTYEIGSDISKLIKENRKPKITSVNSTIIEY